MRHERKISERIRIEFENVAKRKQQIKVLSNLLKIPEEKLNNIQGFIQAKFAEPIRCKHNMIFFTEALNILDRYKDNVNKENDYRIKISKNYQDEYFKALEKGEGYNAMDALEKAFVAEGLDKTESKLYKKIVKYKKILQEPENSNKILRSWKMGIFGIGIVGIIGLAGFIIGNKKKAGNSGSSAQ